MNKDRKIIDSNYNEFNNKNQDSKIREGYFSKYPCSFCYFIFGLFSYTLAFLASEHTKSYIIMFSITGGVFSAVGLLIFFAEYKWYKRDMAMTATEDKYGGIEITESVKGGRNSLFILIIFIIGFWTYASLAIIIVGGIKMVLGVGIIWIIVGPFLFYVYIKFLKGTSEPRKFLINDKFIQIIIPPKPTFHVNWTQIDRIESAFKRYVKYLGKYSQRYIFINELRFIGKNYTQKVQILKGRDFNRKYNEIFELLENYAIRMKKDFIKSEEF
ncbi:MAG: hypothetical protein ACFFDH_21925 [Promethearchaeota archaeon]